MNINYHYDSVKDHVAPSKSMYWISLFAPILILIGTLFQVRNLYLNGSGKFLIGAMLLVVFLLMMMIIGGLKGNKLGKEGQVFLKIENGILTSKLARFGRERKINLTNIESHDINEERIIIKPKGEDELFISFNQIHNEAKKKELVQVIQQLIKI